MERETAGATEASPQEQLREMLEGKDHAVVNAAAHRLAQQEGLSEKKVLTAVWNIQTANTEQDTSIDIQTLQKIPGLIESATHKANQEFAKTVQQSIDNDALTPEMVQGVLMRSQSAGILPEDVHEQVLQRIQAYRDERSGSSLRSQHIARLLATLEPQQEELVEIVRADSSETETEVAHNLKQLAETLKDALSDAQLTRDELNTLRTQADALRESGNTLEQTIGSALALVVKQGDALREEGAPLPLSEELQQAFKALTTNLEETATRLTRVEDRLQSVDNNLKKFKVSPAWIKQNIKNAMQESVIPRLQEQSQHIETLIQNIDTLSKSQMQTLLTRILGEKNEESIQKISTEIQNMRSPQSEEGTALSENERVRLVQLIAHELSTSSRTTTETVRTQEHARLEAIRTLLLEEKRAETKRALEEIVEQSPIPDQEKDYAKRELPNLADALGEAQDSAEYERLLSRACALCASPRQNQPRRRTRSRNINNL